MNNSDAYAIPGIKTMDELIAEAFGVTVDGMKSRTKFRENTEARQFAMWYRLMNSDKSQAEIGKIYGRDHATVIHARKTFYDLYETDNRFKKKADKALELLKNINVS